MDNTLYLHIPTRAQLWYRQRLLADPATMAYNRGYTLGFAGYDSATGCIDFPKKDWEAWYDWFIGGAPARYYAYIARSCDGAFIGEVNLHKSGDGPWYDMGIVIEAAHRGRGYAAPALRLLLAQAFEVLNAAAVHNDFEAARAAALRAHLAAGFRSIGQTDGIVTLEMTQADYFAQKAATL